MVKIMKLNKKREFALAWAIANGSSLMADRLLNEGVVLNETVGLFYVTINGTSLCTLDYALAGGALSDSSCNHLSLRECIGDRSRIKAAFPAAIVAVRAGACPYCSNEVAA